MRVWEKSPLMVFLLIVLVSLCLLFPKFGPQCGMDID